MAKQFEKIGRFFKKYKADLTFVASVGLATFEISHFSPQGAGLFLAVILFVVSIGMKK